MKKILVTGGAGYIGSHTVVELYNAGYTPIILDNYSNSEKSTIAGIHKITQSEIKTYEGDCNDLEFVNQLFEQEKNIYGVIHFAAFKAVGESVERPLEYYQNNVGSLIVLLQSMKLNNVKNIVFSSSCSVYGQPDRLPVTEKSPKKLAESPYGRTKQICEDIMYDYYKSANEIKALVLRYFNPIGAHPTAFIGELPLGVPNNLVPFITQTAAGLRDKLTIFGNDYNTVDGTCVRDYIHVVDLAKAHVSAIRCLLKKKSQFIDFINIGTGNGHTVIEVIKTFEKANNLKLNYEIGERRIGDVEKVYADAKYAMEVLNWHATLSLEEALADAWKWQKCISKADMGAS